MVRPLTQIEMRQLQYMQQHHLGDDWVLVWSLDMVPFPYLEDADTGGTWDVRAVRVAPIMVLIEWGIELHKYTDWMDGEHVGQLFLMHDRTEVEPQFRKMVSWRSTRTNLTTDWHGMWQEIILEDETVQLMVFFDYEGIDVPRLHQRGIIKWTMLTHNRHSGLYCGSDYRGRMITARRHSTWRLPERPPTE